MAKKSKHTRRQPTEDPQSNPKPKATKSASPKLNTKLSSPNTLPALRDNRKRKPPIPNVPPEKQKKSRIRTILDSPDILDELEEMAATGASISTIEARMKWPPGALTNLINKGKTQKVGPYRRFYILFRSWAAEARHRAESAMNVKTPEKWLDRSTTAKMIESSEERILTETLKDEASGIQFKLGAENTLRTLAILKEQGFSIDEALEKGTITVNRNLEHKDADD